MNKKRRLLNHLIIPLLSMTIGMRLLLLMILLLVNPLFSQISDRVVSDNIADCDGATEILNPGTYSIQFTGGIGNIAELKEYLTLKDIFEKNTVWCSFLAPFNGRLSLNASLKKGEAQMIIFQNETNDICGDIFKGLAEIRRLMKKPAADEFGLSLSIDETHLYPIDLMEGQRVMILFQANEKSKTTLNFTLKFEATEDDPEIYSDNAKLIDQRLDVSRPALNIMVRDAETGQPVAADVTIIGLKDKSALYNASDLLFNVDRSGKISLKIDAIGYFFADREEPLSADSEHELVIWLEPLGEGKSVRIDDIEFRPGSSEFMPGAEGKLRRIKDFLALNSNIKVEIQGHVHSLGESTFAGQKISEARAKRVMIYLTNNGIDKSRMTTKGYGNTMPIYENPKFAYEEQANRRVEIKIINE